MERSPLPIGRSRSQVTTGTAVHSLPSAVEVDLPHRKFSSSSERDSCADGPPLPPTAGHISEIDAIDRARAQEYLLLATLLLRAPSQALLDQIAGLVGDDSPLGRAHAALGAAALSTSQDEAGAEFFNLFVGVGRGDVVPYASFYRTGFLHARPLSHMRADMARLGIARGAGVFEPEDHLGTMLEVMAGLIRGDFPATDETQAAFFKEHIQPWAERLLQDIALAPGATFYRAVAEVGHLWLEIETEAFTLPG